MLNRLNDGNSKQTKSRSSRPLTFERLEQRAMMALDVLDGYMRALQEDPPSSNQALVSPIVGTAPTVARPPAIVGGTSVTGRSAIFSVLGQDNGGESSLMYNWQTLSAPSDARIEYLRNDSNLSKSNTLTFNKSGDYNVRVTITDSSGLTTSSDLRFRVVPTFTSIGVRTSTGATVTSNASTTIAGPSERFTIVGLDQFGTTMPTTPSVSWQAVSKPSGSNPTFATSRDTTTATFNVAGTYALRLTSGPISQTFNVVVQPSLRSLGLSSSTGATLSPSQAIVVNGNSHSLKVTGLDQFNRPVTSLPSVTWSVISKPTTGNATVTMSGTSATLNFTAAGIYTLRAQSGGLNLSASFNVAQILTSIRATDSSGTVVPGNGLATQTMNQSLRAIAYDQFGNAMLRQPTITWDVSAKPTGTNPVLTRNANAVSVLFNRAGSYTLRATVAGLRQLVPVSVGQTLSSLSIATVSGAVVQGQSTIQVNGVSQRLSFSGRDQFSASMASTGPITWTTVSGPIGGTATATVSSGSATINFTRAGSYVLRASVGAHSQTLSFTVNQVFTDIVALGQTGQALSTSTPTNVTGTNTRLTAQAQDQFGQPMRTPPSFTWASGVVPTGGSSTIAAAGPQSTVSFNREGQYSIVLSAGGRSLTIPLNVVSTLSGITVTPGSTSILVNAQQTFSVEGRNQFQRTMTVPTSMSRSWTATIGTITSTGVFTAGSVAGNGTVTVQIGDLTATASFQVTSPTPASALQDPALSALVNQFYGDGLLSRTDVIGILRGAGTDGTVSATELADLRFLVTANANYAMPSHARELAKDVVNSNPANLRYQGQAAGNLVAGSSSSLLNNLIDKWFLGTDLPQLTSSGFSYRNATGTLFAAAPDLLDAKQGALGDCYFIASVASIAEVNPDAVRNMFIDNGDNTYTVRFYAGALGAFFTNTGQVSSGFRSGSGVADYVTVNKSLPTYWNGTLAYSGSGLSATSASTTLWIALAEKAYAQWNETGNSGRDGTNRYQAIEGGWMSNVNAQVLGYNSTSFAFTANTKQSMINALNSNRAVTLGTNGSVGSGLVGGHAYVVTGYDVATDRFSVFNPWGNTHPGPLTWAQLQANCSQFVVVDPSGSVSVQSGYVRDMRSISDPIVSWEDDVRSDSEDKSHLTDSIDRNMVSQGESSQFGLLEESTVNGSSPIRVACIDKFESDANRSTSEHVEGIFLIDQFDGFQFLVAQAAT